MDSGSLILVLALFTLVAVLAYAFWQRQRVRASQARHGEKPGGGLDDL